MSVAFVKEESAETAAETQLPDRPVSQHPNLVTEAGLKLLEEQMKAARAAHEIANAVEDVNERRRQIAPHLRDIRYLAERLRTAQVMPAPETNDVVSFGSTVTFTREEAACNPTVSSAKMRPTRRPGPFPMFPPSLALSTASCW